MDVHDLEYFRFIRQEILDRIRIHYRTLVMKFTFTVALLSFLLTYHERIPLSPFLLSSMFAFLFDIILLENLGWIRSTGDFVKWKIEDRWFQIRWECEFAQHSGSWRCFRPASYLAGIWSIGFFLWFGFVAMDFLRNDRVSATVDISLLVISSLLLAYTIFLVFRHLRYPTWDSLRSCWCRRHLGRIGKACIRYAIEHQGRFPASWEELKTDRDTSPYELVPGRVESDPPEMVLAYCREGSHRRRGGNILFVDGSVGWHHRMVFQKILADLKQRGDSPKKNTPRGRGD